MTIKEFIEELKDHDPSALVVISNSLRKPAIQGGIIHRESAKGKITHTPAVFIEVR